MPTHYFTAAEANSLLPQVMSVLSEMMDARQRIIDAQPDLWPVLEKAVGNGGSKKAGALMSVLNGQYVLRQRYCPSCAVLLETDFIEENIHDSRGA